LLEITPEDRRRVWYIQKTGNDNAKSTIHKILRAECISNKDDEFVSFLDQTAKPSNAIIPYHHANFRLDIIEGCLLR
jgi:hypothetical protein